MRSATCSNDTTGVLRVGMGQGFNGYRICVSGLLSGAERWFIEMTAIGVTSERVKNDFYETPAPVVRVLWCEVLAAHRPKCIVDPCAGRGTILDTIRNMADSYQPHTMGIELDPVLFERIVGHESICADALAPEQRWFADTENRPDWCVMNPAFSLLIPFVEKALELVPKVAALASLTFAAGENRYEFWKKNPANVYPLSPRPSFCQSARCTQKFRNEKRGCGWSTKFELSQTPPKRCPICRGKVSVSKTDASEYAWFIWGMDTVGLWRPINWRPYL